MDSSHTNAHHTQVPAVQEALIRKEVHQLCTSRQISPPSHIQWLTQSISTNTDAKKLAAQNHRFAVCLAERQTQGRGQFNRHWYSPTGNIYLSVLMPLTANLSGRLALEVALAILAQPRLQNMPDLGIKWPNDLCHKQDGKLYKWGGILIEPVTTHCVIIGVGINWLTPPNDRVDQAATSLQQLGLAQAQKHGVIVDTIGALLDACLHFETGSPRLSARYHLRDLLLGSHITLDQNGQIRSGICSGVHDDGSLLLTHQGQTHTIYAGRIVHVEL